MSVAGVALTGPLPRAFRGLGRHRSHQTSRADQVAVYARPVRRPIQLDVPATLVPVSPATDLAADSAEQDKDRSNDHQDQTDSPERWETEEEPDDQQDQSQDNHVAPPGSGGCPAQSAGSLPSRTPSKT